MAEEPSEPQQAAPSPEMDTAPVAPRRSRKWKWALIAVGVLVVLPFVVFTVWAGIALSMSYSAGDRAGYVQKFSKKGWVCKTWEGELSMVNIPGAAQERWLFSVRNDSIARLITENMGNRVSLTYEEHPGVPTACFGETDYFVVGVRKVE
jgi:hypothetical protein